MIRKSDDGLIQRFQLVAYPEPKKRKRARTQPDDKALEAACAVFRKLVELDLEKLNAQVPFGGGTPYVGFDRDAQERYYQWDDALSEELFYSDAHASFRAHIGKFSSFIPSLALIRHVVDVGSGLVSKETLELAIETGDFYRKHAERMYASRLSGDIVAARAILKKLKSGAIQKRVESDHGSGNSDRFTARDVYRAGWSGLDKETTKSGIDCLAEYGWVQLDKKGNTVFAVIHPELRRK
jgi:hypothetical protein